MKGATVVFVTAGLPGKKPGPHDGGESMRCDMWSNSMKHWVNICTTSKSILMVLKKVKTCEIHRQTCGFQLWFMYICALMSETRSGWSSSSKVDVGHACFPAVLWWKTGKPRLLLDIWYWWEEWLWEYYLCPHMSPFRQPFLVLWRSGGPGGQAWKTNKLPQHWTAAVGKNSDRYGPHQ